MTFAIREPDAPCAFCGRDTNMFAGSPLHWPVWFPHPGDSGIERVHHVGCVMDRLFPPKKFAMGAHNPGRVGGERKSDDG